MYKKRKNGGRGLKSFKEVYDETKTRVACYMATSSNEWIRTAWKNEIYKEQISIKRAAENAMRKVNVITIFDEGTVTISEERHTEWKTEWKKLKNILEKGQKSNKEESLAEKVFQGEIPTQYGEDDYGWLKCNTHKKQQQYFHYRSRWSKKIRGLVEDDKCRLCGQHRETVQHLLSGCKRLAGSEYVKRHDNTLKVLAVKWAIENGLLAQNTKWYAEKWERRKVLENNGKKLYWDWEHRMRTNYIARRPDLTLEDSVKKTILLIDMACPNEANKEVKREEKIRKYQQLCFELRGPREGYTVMVIPMIIGCLGGGMKELKQDLGKFLITGMKKKYM